MKCCCDMPLPFTRKKQQSFATLFPRNRERRSFVVKPVGFATIGNPTFNGVTWRFVLCSLHQGKPEPYG